MKNIIPFSILLIILACNKSEVVNSTQEVASPILSKNLEEYNNNAQHSEQIDNQLARLGRVLFYDKKLSFNDRVSCGSCHIQSLGFGDNKAKSIGFAGQLTDRNSSSIINLNKFNPLFWDARQNQLDSMVILPILNHIEMGISNIDIVKSRVSQYAYYKDLFKLSFGDEEVTKERLGRALAEFVRSIRTSDHFNARLNTMSNTEGIRLFNKYNCNSCHAIGDVNTSWGADMANTGLDIVDKDLGAGAIAGIPEMNGFFKIPSLINVGLTAPYMHDGRFKTLEEVLDHYSGGIQPNKNLDFRLREGFEDQIFNPIFGGRLGFFANQKQISSSNTVAPKHANITDRDKKVLVDFLKSLIDETLIQDRKYSNPFLN